MRSHIHLPEVAAPGRSVLARLAPPYTFAPDLRLGEAFCAAAGFVTRLITVCLWFAVWGAVSMVTWSRIGGNFWRVVAAFPLVFVFLSVLAGLLLAISAVERGIAKVCRR